jgi:signal transduction histidine kinase
MRRLFWKFFAIIWLAMAGSIAVVFMLSALFQVSPASMEMERARQSFAADVGARLLLRDGREAARAFLSAAMQAEVPVRLAIVPGDAATACVAAPEPPATAGTGAVTCDRIVVLSEPPGLISETWQRAVPWLSALLAAAAAAYLLARYLIRPVAHLRYGLSALASGRFEVRIGDRLHGRQDEVAALVHDFDSSAARLEQLHKAQQRLFHDVSHELRSPLSRLQAAIGVLQQNPAKLDAATNRMVHEIERIDALIGEILTLARLTDRASDRLELQTVDVVDLLHDIVSDAEFEGQSRKVRVTYDGEESFVATVNGELIYRAIENVIRNALRYAPDSSTVTVEARRAGGRMRICVTDGGPGVAVADLERIFLPFSRGDGSGQAGGHGLGLAIAREAVLRHGGRVSAELAANGGLCVTLEIPERADG